MTYQTGQPILANDYNTFVSLAQQIKEVFWDLHGNATTIAQGADFGYGHLLTTDVLPLTNITANQWSALFNEIRNCGIHQGVATVPPLPATNPLPLSTIISYSGVDTLISTLKANRLNLAAGQSVQTSVNSPAGSSPWSSTLKYTFSVVLGTWNQARYFFNSGGWIGISGSYPGNGSPPSTDDFQWYDFLTKVGTIRINAKNTTSLVTNTSATNGGLWNSTSGAPLGIANQEIFKAQYGGGGYYTNSTISVNAKLRAAAPAANSGTIDIEIVLTQADTHLPLNPKTLNTTFTTSETHSAGVIPFLSSAAPPYGPGPGPSVVQLIPGTFTRN